MNDRTKRPKNMLAGVSMQTDRLSLGERDKNKSSRSTKLTPAIWRMVFVDVKERCWFERTRGLRLRGVIIVLSFLLPWRVLGYLGRRGFHRLCATEEKLKERKF